MLKRIGLFISCLVIPLGIGYVSSILTIDQVKVYQNLTKPPFSPKPEVFGIVWTILYVLMGLALFFAINSSRINKKTDEIIMLFFFHIALNFTWSIIYFVMGYRWMAFIILLFMLYTEYALTKRYKTLSNISFVLSIPYIIWLIYAGYLNLFTAILNQV